MRLHSPLRAVRLKHSIPTTIPSRSIPHWGLRAGASIEGCFRASKICVEQVLQQLHNNNQSAPFEAERMPAVVNAGN